MSSHKGMFAAAKLSELLHSVIDWTSHAQTQNNDSAQNSPPDEARQFTQQYPNNQSQLNSQSTTPESSEEENNMSQKTKSSSSGAFITTLVSAIALIFSGFSFYETVLKQAEMKLYAPALIHMYRKDFLDVLAIPLTISNDGAKRGTVLSFDLKVTNTDTNESKTFQNLYFGNNPKDTSRIFTPLTIAGRSSQAEVIMFYADKTGAFFETTGGVKLNLQFELKMNLDQSEFYFPQKNKNGLTFDMGTSFIQSFRQMEQGSPTVLYHRETPKKQAAPAPENKTEPTPENAPTPEMAPEAAPKSEL